MRPTVLVLFGGSLLLLVSRIGHILDIVGQGGAERGIAVLLFGLMIGCVWYLVRPVRLENAFVRSVLRNGEVQWGLALVAVMCFIGLFAPLITPHDPSYALYGRLRDPSLTHLLGTDTSGRDAFSRLLYGARLSLQTGVFATALAIVMGAVVGTTAALSGPRTDGVLMRLVDAGLAFPRVFLLLALIALLPSVNQLLLVLILGFTSWFDIARIVRGEVITIRRTDFVVATTGLGLPSRRVIGAHILPNVAGPLIVSASLSIGYLILLESGLSYLGIGASAGTPSWGKLIEEGYTQLRDAPQLTLAPGALLAITVIGFSLIGDGLRQSLDPRNV